jgi:3-oxoacid CoA-transferase subunit A
MASTEAITSETAERRFIRRAMKAPLLAADHEHDLAKRWREENDEDALHELTGAYMRLVVAMAGKLCIVEVEEIVETGDMIPDQIHLPGIYVHRLVLNKHPEKRIEKRTVTEKAGV